MKCNPCLIADLLPKRRNAQNLTPLYGFGAILGVFFRYERLCFSGGIGFSNPFMAGGLADAFETYGKQHPDVSIHIFSGEESELCRELETHKLDIIFLPENTDISEKTHYNARMVLLRCAPVVMEYADLAIEPITQNPITQIALWRDSKKSPVVDFFFGCLNKFAVDQSQM